MTDTQAPGQGIPITAEIAREAERLAQPLTILALAWLAGMPIIVVRAGT